MTQRLKVRRGFPFELRATDETDKTLTIEGYAAIFDQETDLGWFRELVRPGAFKKTLAENDQVAVYNHQTGETLARKSAGTLVLQEDDKGLYMRATLDPAITGHADTYRRIKRGDVKGMSFGFEVIKDAFVRQEGQTKKLRELQEVRLFEVSPTPFPAYEMTEVEARSLDAVNVDPEATTEAAGAPADDHGEATTEAAGAESENITTEEPSETHSTAGLWRLRLLKRKTALAQIE